MLLVILITLFISIAYKGLFYLYPTLCLHVHMCILYTDEGVYIHNKLYVYVKELRTCMSDMINKFPHHGSTLCC